MLRATICVTAREWRPCRSRRPLDDARVIEIHDPEVIRTSELEPHHLAKGERVLFKTGNSEHCWKTDQFQEKYIYIAPEAARYLAERGIQTVGVDYLSVGGFESGRPGDPPHPVRSRHLDHRRPDAGARRTGRV